MELLDILRRALAAIANTSEDDIARALLKELRALIVAVSFVHGTKEAKPLIEELGSAEWVAGFRATGPADIDECIRHIVAAEQAIGHVPPDVYNFVAASVAGLVPLGRPATGLVQRLLSLMHEKDCGIDSRAALDEAVERLNSFELYPQEVTAERYELLAAGKLCDEQVTALSAVELNALVDHAGRAFLCARVKRRTTRSHILASASEPDAKRPRTE